MKTLSRKGAGSAVGEARARVALVAHDIHDGGGMEHVLAELIRRAASSVDFVVVSRELSDDLRPLVEWQRVWTPGRPFPIKFGAFWLVASLRLARLRVDLVHTTGAIIANRVDIATVHFCHAAFTKMLGRLTLPGGPPLRRINAGLARLLALAAERWSYRRNRLSTFAAVSEGMADELKSFYATVPVVVTPNGVDATAFRPDEGARSKERLAARLRPGATVAVFVGGDWDRKGLDLAIEGLATAVRSGADALELWVVGRGNPDRYRALARALGIDERVRFIGFQADVRRFYQAADIFVFPSIYEACPLVPYEAAACGLPILATACNGLTELVGADEAGMLLPRTSEAFGAALALLAGDPALAAQMGQAGVRRTRALTWERSAEDVLALYRAVLASSHPATLA